MSSEGVSSLYIPEYMRILWYIHWAAYGAPLWNELYPSKKDNWRTAQPEGVGCPTPTSKEPIFVGHFRSSSEQIWKSILKEPKIIAWSYWPYIHAE